MRGIFDSRQRQAVVVVRGDPLEDMILRTPTNRRASQSALLVRKSSEGRRLEAVYVEGLNAMLYPDTNPNGSHAQTERLPIS